MYEVSCSKCEKKFARKDNLKKHLKICCVCKQCSKNFENIKEWKDHNCAKKAVFTNKKVSSLEEGSKTANCSFEVSRRKKSLKIRRCNNSKEATCPTAKKLKHNIVEDEQMDETDADIKEFTKKYWSSIPLLTRKTRYKIFLIFITTRI